VTWAAAAWRRTWPVLGLWLVVSTGVVSAHPFYVTVSQIDHNASERTLEITIKFFTDDLQRALEQRAGSPLFLGTDREADAASQRLFEYVVANVELVIDGHAATLRYVGKEVETDATWCYVEVVDVASPTRITVTNRLLLDYFDTQSNIVHVKVGGVQKSLLLRDGHVSEQLAF